jgi:DNA-binding transcriptional LysR family regulator
MLTIRYFLPSVDVQISQLRALLAVVRHESFSRAARELNLTQPAVSMQVRQLERTVGSPLLERVGKRAFPTPAGDLLLAHAGRALAELETGVAAVQNLRGVVAGRVRLGTSASISTYLLPPALRRFRARYPHTELIVATGNAPEIARAVVANDLDLAVLSLPVRERELAVTPFLRDDLVVIAAPAGRGPVAGAGPRRGAQAAGSLRAAELSGVPLILTEQGSTVRRVIDAWLRRAGVPATVAMELDNTEAIKRLVDVGLGRSIISSFAVREDVRAGRLVARKLDPPLFRQIGIARRRDKPLTPALEAFLGELDSLRRGLARRADPLRRGRTTPAAGSRT